MIKHITFSAGILLIPSLSYAHGGHGSGFIEGFTHPIFGVDHFLTIIGIAILAYTLDPKKWYKFIGVFIIMMIIGGIIGIGKEASPAIEKIIAISVLAIGVGILFLPLTKSTLAILSIIAIIGFFHGYAHGVEMSETNTIYKYVPGYSVGAILLSSVGWQISKYSSDTSNPIGIYRFIGGLIAGAGIIIVIGG